MAPPNPGPAPTAGQDSSRVESVASNVASASASASASSVPNAPTSLPAAATASTSTLTASTPTSASTSTPSGKAAKAASRALLAPTVNTSSAPAPAPAAQASPTPTHPSLPFHHQRQHHLPHHHLSQNHRAFHHPTSAAEAAAAARHSNDLGRRASKKLQKRNPPRQSMDFPERLKQHGPVPEDEEDLRPNTQGQGVYVNLNQSIFGLIAAAGSSVNFNNRFEGQSSDEEDEGDDQDGGDDEDRAPVPARPVAASAVLPTKEKKKRWHRDLSQSTIFSKHSSGSSSPKNDVSPSSSKNDRRSDGSPGSSKKRLSLPSLKNRLSSRSRHSRSASKKLADSRIDEADNEEEDDDGATQTPPSFDGPAIQVTRAQRERSDSVRSIAPVMSRMLEAKAELAARPSFDLDRLSGDKARDSKKDNQGGGGGDDDDDDDAGGPSALARRLMEIFDFEKPEEVIDEYPCWLLQSVLLQGYMYITAHHICFYAYLPKKANEVAKSGYLAKSGKRNPKYNRYWFRLKGDVLAYYRDPSNLYFPHGQIDLRYGISATVSDKDKEGVHFQVVTHHRTYYFRADSAPSAKEWVKSLQRVIFRSHNEGDSVKISLPIGNIIDIEETQTMVEFADTCKIRVIDNDETYAIDEYFFSFFDSGKEAVRVLRILIDDNDQATPSKNNFTRKSLAEDRESQDSSNMFGEQAAAAAAAVSTPGTPGRTVPTAAAASDSRLLKLGKMNSAVRATLSPVSPGASSPRASTEIPRSSFDGLRASFSPSRRSFDTSRLERPPHRSFSEHGSRSASVDRRHVSSSSMQRQQSEKQDSSDSFVQSSMEDPSQASFSGLVASASDIPSSGSQILHGSDVFQSPTVARRSNSATRRRERHSSSNNNTPGTQSPGRAAMPPPIKKPVHAATTGGLSDRQSSFDQQQAARQSMDSQGPIDGQSQASLQNLAKYGSYPLQRAGIYAGWINKQSRKMSSLLATESMGYVEKVSGMWKGGHRHYDEPPDGLRVDEDLDDGIRATGPDVAESNERFQAHFALSSSEKLQATYFGYLMRVLPLYGKIYISNRSFCFRSLLPGTRTKLILPLRDIENSTKEKGFRFGFAGLVVVIRGHEELFFEFGQADMRDDCAVTLLQGLESTRFMRESGVLSEDDKAGAETALAERDALQEARQEAAARQDENPDVADPKTAATPASAHEDTANSASLQHKILRQTAMMSESPTILFDDPKASFLNFKPAEPLRVTCLTIGSRGDVQPYIALGKGLLAEGHRVKIATHPEFEGWIRSHGLDYGRVEGDPGELMRICIENGTFTLQFLREANSKMRTWLDELLASAWTACQDSDLLIESPSAMAGIHIAEKMQIPYFRAFTMPWTRTRAYPHAFIMPEHKMGGAYNYITYVMFDNVFWKATASQINRWRNKTLGLPNTTLEKMQPNKVPFLYNFSPSVVPPPLDYSDWIRVTGYWFLDEGSKKKEDDTKSMVTSTNDSKSLAKSSDASSRSMTASGESSADKAESEACKDEKPEKPAWTPPQDLSDFIAKARQDKKKLVYVGFGSILVPDPAKMTQEVIDAVLKADVRCILSKGWSDRMAASSDKKGEKGSKETKESKESKESKSKEPKEKAAAGKDEKHDPSKLEVPLPPEIFLIKSAPHDWLFAQIDAAAHHGGSGTTGASLRAGIPTIIRPFFGDQFFFGGRVEDLGVGICLKKWGAYSFGRALWEATNSQRMIKKAKALGEQIRQENGVDTAIQCIYRDMEYAKSLVKAKAGKSATTTIDGTPSGVAYEEDQPEESWTFVGDDMEAMQQSVILSPEKMVGAAAGGNTGNKALGSRVMGMQAI